MNYLVTFYTQLDAVIARKTFQGRTGALCNLQPIPRSLSSSCGTCAKIQGVSLDEIKEIEHESVFLIQNDKYIKVEE